MENWKRAAVAGAFGAAAVLLLNGKRPAGVLAAGVGLAVLAAEYPEKFEQFREDLPYYVERGSRFLEVVSRVGTKFAEVGEKRGKSMLEELLSY